jgi:polyhydroxybutyrate depolymerase
MWRTALMVILILAMTHPVRADLETRLTLEHDGLTRFYDLYVPETTGAEARPLVLDLHGFTSSAGQQRTWSGVRELAEAERLYAAWPSAIDASWNAVIGDPGIDDVGFLRSLVQELARRHEVDFARIYVTGFSQGGVLTQRLACEASDLFAAFVSMAGSIVAGSEQRCGSPRPVPILTWRGENDELVPYDGGVVSLPGLTYSLLSARDVFDFWRGRNQCGAGVTRDNLSSDSFCDEAASCGAGTRTRFCTVQGSSRVSPHIIYDNTAGLNLASESWNFLQSFTHPNPLDTAFTMNPGLNDAWFNADTSGQGFFINVFADTGVVFLAWFTYDTERPPPDVEAVLGEPGHRWLTALGSIEGAEATLEVTNTTGGLFDQGEPAPVNDNDYGTIRIRFEDCATGVVEYDLTEPGVSGSISIQRVVQDNVSLCETISDRAD